MIDPPPGLANEPGVVGVGIDLVSVERLAAVLQRRSGFAARVFSEAEIDHCSAAPDPAASFAARFAVKEAVVKVLRVGIFGVALRDVQLVGGGNRPPSLHLDGRAAAVAADAGIARWLVSITHDAGWAAAVVVGLAR